MSQEQYDVLIPIQEELSHRHHINYEVCCRCTREDIFLSTYIISICSIIFGGCIFILVWLIVNKA
jgi:hypothetical protein